MSKIEVVNYDINKVYELVKQNLYSCKVDFTEVKDAMYHHNSSYKLTPQIIEKGILSYKSNILAYQKRDLNDKENIKFSDESHVNGTDQISLSSLNIDMNNVSEDEFLYNHEKYDLVDILVSSSVKTVRNRINYANEFLAHDKIANDNFKAIDIRLLSYQYRLNKINVDSLIANYNYLREIACALKDNNLNIPLRERGLEDFNLDVEKVKSLPELRVK